MFFVRASLPIAIVDIMLNVDIVMGDNGHNMIGVELVSHFHRFIQALQILMARIDHGTCVVGFYAIYIWLESLSSKINCTS